MIAVALFVFIVVLRIALRQRSERPSRTALLVVASIVVVGGMCFAKLGATAGFPVWLYYGLPAGLTWFLPPLAFRMRRQEVVPYLALAFLSAPTVHIAFSLVLGWKEYMPFLAVPSLAEILGWASVRAG